MDPYVYRDFSPVLGVLLWRFGSFAFPFGLLAPLAAVGMVVTVVDRRLRIVDCRLRGASTNRQSAILNPQSSPTRDDATAHRGRLALALFVTGYGASIVLFFVTARYRLPVAVVLTLFAAAGVEWIWQQVWGRGRNPASRRLRAAAAATFLAVAVVVNLPIVAPTDAVNFRAEHATNVGQAFADMGRLDQAETQFRRGLELEPQCAVACYRLANVLARRGDLVDAEQLARRALALDKRSVNARCTLSDVLHRDGRLTEAADVLTDALAIDPLFPEAHAGLADLRFKAGLIDQAIHHYRQAVKTARQPGIHLIGLADALAQQGAYEEAIDRYRQALWMIEPEPETLNRIAWLLATCPQAELRDCAQAIELAGHMCEITAYSHPVALDTLAAAYAECGSLQEAVRWVGWAILLAEEGDDQAAADSFRPRLRMYQHRLDGSVKPPSPDAD